MYGQWLFEYINRPLEGYGNDSYNAVQASIDPKGIMRVIVFLFHLGRPLFLKIIHIVKILTQSIFIYQTHKWLEFRHRD